MTPDRSQWHSWTCYKLKEALPPSPRTSTVQNIALLTHFLRQRFFKLRSTSNKLLNKTKKTCQYLNFISSYEFSSFEFLVCQNLKFFWKITNMNRSLQEDAVFCKRTHFPNPFRKKIETRQFCNNLRPRLVFLFWRGVLILQQSTVINIFCSVYPWIESTFPFQRIFYIINILASLHAAQQVAGFTSKYGLVVLKSVECGSSILNFRPLP